MSKAVTNEEVEDVLSSIRRLVSEDKRPLAGLRSTPVEAVEPETGPVEDAAETADEVPVEANRLVLTPALRVLPSEREAEADEQQDTADDGPLDLGSVAHNTWSNDESDDIADDELPEEAAQADAQPMMLFPAAKQKDDDPAMAALDALVHDAIESEAKSMEDALDESDYGDEAFWDEDENDAEEEHVPSHAASDHSDLEDATFDESDTWDLQEEEDAPRVTEDTGAHLSEDVQDDIKEDFDLVEEMASKAFEADDELEDEVRAEPQEGAAAVARVPLTAKIAALEAALRGTREQEWDPDGDEEDELALRDGPAMAWEDDVELDAKGEPYVAPAQEEAAEHTEKAAEPEAQPAAAASSGDDQLMDEDALRELVSELVRAELQGPLGERITRNVRKLVRREIHRALTAQEME